MPCRIKYETISKQYQICDTAANQLTSGSQCEEARSERRASGATTDVLSATAEAKYCVNPGMTGECASTSSEPGSFFRSCEAKTHYDRP